MREAAPRNVGAGDDDLDDVRRLGEDAVEVGDVAQHAPRGNGGIRRLVRMRREDAADIDAQARIPPEAPHEVRGRGVRPDDEHAVGGDGPARRAELEAEDDGPLHEQQRREAGEEDQHRAGGHVVVVLDDGEDHEHLDRDEARAAQKPRNLRRERPALRPPVEFQAAQRRVREEDPREGQRQMLVVDVVRPSETNLEPTVVEPAAVEADPHRQKSRRQCAQSIRQHGDNGIVGICEGLRHRTRENRTRRLFLTG